jgi:hypothetical protein
MMTNPNRSGVVDTITSHGHNVTASATSERNFVICNTEALVLEQQASPLQRSDDLELVVGCDAREDHREGSELRLDAAKMSNKQI